MMPPVSAFPDVLARCRAVADPALRAAVDELPGPVRRVERYHFAWSDEHGNPTGGGAGKAMRPALALLSAEAVGGRIEDASRPLSPSSSCTTSPCCTTTGRYRRPNWPTSPR